MANEKDYDRKIKDLEAKIADLEKKKKANTSANHSQNAAYKARVESPELKREVLEEKLRQKNLQHVLEGIELEDPAEEYYKQSAEQPRRTFGRSAKDKYYEAKTKTNTFSIAKAIPMIIACIVVLVVFNLYAETQEQQQQKEKARNDKANSMTAVAADTIADAFANSPYSANQKYKDERVKVRGKVTLISIVNSNATVTIDAGENGVVYAYFNNLDGIRNLKTGDTLTFVGDCKMYSSVAVGNYTITYVYFYDCKPA